MGLYSTQGNVTRASNFIAIKKSSSGKRMEASALIAKNPKQDTSNYRRD